MRPLELLVVYALLGVCVAGAMVRVHRPGVLYAVPFWPLFLPGLLAGVAGTPRAATPTGWSSRIDAAVDALRGALGVWEALPDVVDCERSLGAARRGLEALAERHAQLAGVLSAGEHGESALRAELSRCAPAARPLLEARLASLTHLARLRDEAAADLERGLAGLAELAARVHVARFTGGAASGLAEQLAALAAAVDSASEVRRLG